MHTVVFKRPPRSHWSITYSDTLLAQYHICTVARTPFHSYFIRLHDLRNVSLVITHLSVLFNVSSEHEVMVQSSVRVLYPYSYTLNCNHAAKPRRGGRWYCHNVCHNPQILPGIFFHIVKGHFPAVPRLSSRKITPL